ncbi:ANTAR domain-containing protein [Streptomyces sp. NPDC001020]
MAKRPVLQFEESCEASSPMPRVGPSAGLLPPCLTVETRGAGDRTAVLVSGELDIGTERALRDALHDALRCSVSGVDLDLAGVDFCDCSGLNALLLVRRRALRDAKTLVLTATGSAVGRLLSLTGTRSLFDPAGTVVDGSARRSGECPVKERAPVPAGKRSDDTEQNLHIELVQLRRAMQTRPVIDLARGVLMASFTLSAQDAWSVLVTVSQRTNIKLHRVAQDVVEAVEGDAPPEPIRQELTTAVRALRETGSRAAQTRVGEHLTQGL